MPLTFIHPCPTSVMLGNSRFVVSYRTIALMPYKGYGYAAKVCCSKVYNINRSVTRAPFLKYCVRKTEQGHSHITYLDRKNVD